MNILRQEACVVKMRLEEVQRQICSYKEVLAEAIECNDKLTEQQVLEKSMELDILINLYYKLLSGKNVED